MAHLVSDGNDRTLENRKVANTWDHVKWLAKSSMNNEIGLACPMFILSDSVWQALKITPSVQCVAALRHIIHHTNHIVIWKVKPDLTGARDHRGSPKHSHVMTTHGRTGCKLDQLRPALNSAWVILHLPASNHIYNFCTYNFAAHWSTKGNAFAAP